MESLLPLKEELDKTNAKIQEMNDNLERWVCEINNNKSMTESEKNEIRLKVFSHFLMSNTFQSLRDFNSEVLWSEISESFSGLQNRMEELEKARHAAFGKLESLLGINRDKLLSMTKLESRPSKVGLWEYVFFIDVEGHAEDEPVHRALNDLQEEAAFLKVIGAYPKAVL